MSSRLIREDKGASATPIVWRAAGALARPRQAEPGKALVPEARVSELQQEAEARARAAYQQGQAAGEAAAMQQAQQKLDPVLKGFNAVIAELATMRKRTRAEAEDDTMRLAIAIARRVLYRELSTDPEAILGLVKAAFSKLNARETHRLRLSPSDAALVGEQRAKLQMPPGLEIVADRSLMAGSAIFETSRGELDASVDTQLQEIDRGLTDLLKRQK